MVLSHAKALISLQMAESKALSKQGRILFDWGARIHWACEKDSACQKVLTSTFGNCCFEDVKDVQNIKADSTGYCVTHGMQCPIHVESTKGRLSTSHLVAFK